MVLKLQSCEEFCRTIKQWQYTTLKCLETLCCLLSPVQSQSTQKLFDLFNQTFMFVFKVFISIQCEDRHLLEILKVGSV